MHHTFLISGTESRLYKSIISLYSTYILCIRLQLMPCRPVCVYLGKDQTKAMMTFINEMNITVSVDRQLVSGTAVIRDCGG